MGSISRGFMKIIAAIVASIITPFIAVWVAVLMIPVIWKDLYEGISWRKK